MAGPLPLSGLSRLLQLPSLGALNVTSTLSRTQLMAALQPALDTSLTVVSCQPMAQSFSLRHPLPTLFVLDDVDGQLRWVERAHPHATTEPIAVQGEDSEAEDSDEDDGECYDCVLLGLQWGALGRACFDAWVNNVNQHAANMCHVACLVGSCRGSYAAICRRSTIMQFS